MRPEICIVACAEAWRGDGEILASPIGAIPSVAAKLARATFAPELLLTDGVASLVDSEGRVEGDLPYRAVFDLVWSGRRHVMMGASQIDRFGNQNISAVGDWRKPKAQLIGARGAPGNTINHPTSYWVPQHSKRVFVERVDFVCGVGYDKPARGRFHELRRVVTNLCVLGFVEGVMCLKSLHPGVTVEEVQSSTGFPLMVPREVPQTRAPSDEELQLIAKFDPEGRARKEVA